MTAGSSNTRRPAEAGHHDDVSIRVGISACLLGEEVRFDGGHKRDLFLTEEFGRFVEWVPVCPEVEAGFGTPREAMHLRRSKGELRLVTVKTDVALPFEMESLIPFDAADWRYSIDTVYRMARSLARELVTSLRGLSSALP